MAAMTSTETPRAIVVARVANAVVALALAAAVAMEPEWSFFTWHPVGMILWMWASTEGMLIIQTSQTLALNERKTYTRNHWILTGLATAALLGAYAVIYVNKELRGKHHLTSWHAWVGIATIAVVVYDVGCGTGMHFFPTMGTAKQLAFLLKLHRFLGYALYALSTLTIMLAFWSKWFLRSIISDQVFAISVVGVAIAFIATVSSMDRRAIALFTSSK